MESLKDKDVMRTLFEAVPREVPAGKEKKIMKQWLLQIRKPVKRYTVWEGIRRILLCFFLGILLGMLAKQLDLVSYDGATSLNRALEWLDLRNFLSDLPFWLAVGLAIAVHAPSAFQAGDGVFFFFLGMCGAYHWYSVHVGGFNPSGYMRIWYGLTAVSPLLGWLCWYAKGKGYAAGILQTLIQTVLVLACFSFGFWYFDFLGILYTATFLICVFILNENPKRTLLSLGIALVLAFLLRGTIL